MNKSNLLAIIRSYRDNAHGADGSTVNSERAEAMDHYHGRPYGDEIEGRSQVVARDVAETVDWAMPALMRTFLQSGNLAEFDPVGPEDEEQAQQESDYANHVILKDNNGFIVLHDAIKDALILKNGYFKYWWDESERIKEPEYSGLVMDELVMLMQDAGDEVEVLEQDERLVDVGGMLLPVYDIKLRTKSKAQRLRIEALPPEETLIAKSCRGSTQESPFTAHLTRKTRSELVEMGMDREFVYNLPAYDNEDGDGTADSRDSIDAERDDDLGLAYDRSMDEIEYMECYIRVDYDGDGVAELRRVIVAGEQIPDGGDWNEVVDSVQIINLVGKRVPHRHIGESLDDELADLQRIKTSLFRQLLDNAYFTNAPEMMINERAKVSDFLEHSVGGVKRIQGTDPVQGAAAPVPVQPIIQNILPVIDYVDGVKENRSGVNASTTGMDPDALQDTTKGAYLENLNRASHKIEMIARMLAETGIKELVLKVHEMLIKHQDKPRMVKLRGKFVPVNPAEWKERTDLTVKVGIGTGSDEEKRQRLMMLGGLQQQIGEAFSMVGPQHAYKAFVDISRTLGFDAPEQYAFDPASPEYQQHMQQLAQRQQANPLAEAEQIKAQSGQQIAMLRAQMDQMRETHKHEMDLLKMRYEQSEARAERASREAIEAAKLEFQAYIAGLKAPDIGPAGMGGGLGNG